MYAVRGFKRKKGVQVREELSCEQGQLWSFLRDYEAFWVTWKARSDPEAMREMLESFLGALEARGVDIICYERNEPDPDKEVVPKCLAIEEVRKERLAELASRVAGNEIKVSPPEGALDGHICTFSSGRGVSPMIHVWSDEAAGWSLDEHFPMHEERRKLFCMHVRGNRVIIHLADKPYGREFSHGLTIYRGEPTVPLEDYPERVEVDFPETGLAFEIAEMARLYRLLFVRYKMGLLETGQYGKFREVKEGIERLNLLGREELVDVAELAVEELKKCRQCDEEFGGRLERVFASEGRMGAVIAYALSAEEAEELEMARRKAMESAKKWADRVLTKQHRTVADAEREAAEGNAGRPVLVPVHLGAMWNSVELYIGHDAHPVYDIAEAIKKHVEEVLRGREWDYTVERC